MSCKDKHNKHNSGSYGYDRNDDDYVEWYYDDDLESLPYGCSRQRANQDIRRFQVQYNRMNPPFVLRPAIKSFEGRGQFGENYGQPYDPTTGKYHVETIDELEYGVPNESELYTMQRRRCQCYNREHKGRCTNGCVNSGFDCTHDCFPGFQKRNIPNLTPARLAHQKNNALFVEDQIQIMESRRQKRYQLNAIKKSQSDRRLANLQQTFNAYEPGQIPWWERLDGRDC